MATGDHVTSEIWLLPADNPLAEPSLVSARQPGREYDVDEHDGILFIHTNDTSTNFRLATARIEEPGAWAELIPASPAYIGHSSCRESVIQYVKILLVAVSLTKKKK